MNVDTTTVSGDKGTQGRGGRNGIAAELRVSVKITMEGSSGRQTCSSVGLVSERVLRCTR